jgi:hypothetical protein
MQTQTHAQTHRHTHTHTHARTHAHTHAHTHTHTHTDMWCPPGTCMRTHPHTCPHTHGAGRLYVHPRRQTGRRQTDRSLDNSNSHTTILVEASGLGRRVPSPPPPAHSTAGLPGRRRQLAELRRTVRSHRSCNQIPVTDHCRQCQIPGQGRVTHSRGWSPLRLEGYLKPRLGLGMPFATFPPHRSIYSRRGNSKRTCCRLHRIRRRHVSEHRRLQCSQDMSSPQRLITQTARICPGSIAKCKKTPPTTTPTPATHPAHKPTTQSKTTSPTSK